VCVRFWLFIDTDRLKWALLYSFCELFLAMANRQFTSVSPKRQSAINRATVLAILEQLGDASPGVLVKATGLQKSSISYILDDLLAAGLIQRRTLAASGRGRPPTVLSLNEKAGCFAGVHWTLAESVLVLCDFTGNPLRTLIRPAPASLADGVAALPDQLAKLTEGTADGQRLFGVGVGLSGVVDSSAGRVLHSYLWDTEEMSLGSEISQAIGGDIHVAVENHAKLAALAEQAYGVGQQCSNFLTLFLHGLPVDSIACGVTVGSALVLDGRLVHGHRFAAGELDDYFGELIRSEGSKAGAITSWDPAVSARIGRQLGERVAHIVNYLAPEKVIVQADFPRLPPIFVSGFTDGVMAGLVTALRQSLSVERSALSDTLVPLGAVAALRNDLFSPDVQRNLLIDSGLLC